MGLPRCAWFPAHSAAHGPLTSFINKFIHSVLGPLTLHSLSLPSFHSIAFLFCLRSLPFAELPSGPLTAQPALQEDKEKQLHERERLPSFTSLIAGSSSVHSFHFFLNLIAQSNGKKEIHSAWSRKGRQLSFF